MTIYTLFINGKQKDYTDKRRAYAVARLFGAVVLPAKDTYTHLKKCLLISKEKPTVLCRGYLFALFRPVVAPWAVFYARLITYSSAVLSPFLRRFIALWLGGIFPSFRNK